MRFEVWLQQVTEGRQQRILFKLLRQIRFYGEAHVRERLRTAHAMVSVSLPKFVKKIPSDRRMDIIVTYVDGEGKSGQYYAAQYAEENGISVECIKSPDNFTDTALKHIRERGQISGIIIMDDIVATGKSLARNVYNFIRSNAEILSGKNIFVVTILATVAADTHIRKELSAIEGVNVDFRTCEILGDDAYAFGPGNHIWETEEEYKYAKGFCIELGKRIYPRYPLGYGNQGLLVVFPTTVPNNSLPILYAGSRAGSEESWFPLFERVTN